MVRLFSILVLMMALSAQCAVRFDGTSSRAIGWLNSTNLNLTNEITISIWIIKEAGISGSCEYLNKGRGTSASSCNYAVRDDGAGGIELYFASPDASYHGIKSVTKCTQTNTPIHIAVTHKFGTTNQSMFWINGGRGSGQASFGSPQSTGAITNNGVIEFFGYSGGGVHVKGSLLECAIFDAILQPNEIYELSEPLSFQPFRRKANLRAYWTFTESKTYLTVSGQAWRDQSGWNSHLTATNSPQARPSLISIP